ncbi:redoxin domain-containing protein [Devosia sp. ZB163]|uniref:redoxin domain-containing protein n=1 Tax=Devosia sp. ZB163 TaxID=3025938 RepID=UPI00235EE5C3|nr:redoxin domain-containing protein [Devosia sp. ZB163]MDC9822655.1 redoxin domain-containing protein [Devosia sp. ZB163]
MARYLQPGTKAPAFSLPVTPDQKLALSELAGRRVILTFYPADWSPVCGDQLALYNQILPEFRRRGAELLGISVDGAWCHQEFAKARNLHFPILADFHPKGAVATAYGCYMEDVGEAARALFLIDEQGMIVWSYQSPLAVNPGADGILDALDKMPAVESLDVDAKSARKRA